VKQLRLTKALTLPEATAVSEACRRRVMAKRQVDAALLTDADGMLSGIVTAEVRIYQEEQSERLKTEYISTLGEMGNKEIMRFLGLGSLKL
jgi:signal-transduction protein with cAMP-binding, CBS, and nucleotidyltransferase domain